MLCRATRDRRVMVEGCDKTWSTGERHGKPLQSSCLENPMNSNDKAKRYNHKQAATHEVLDLEKLDKRCEWLKWPCTTCISALQDSLLWGNWYCYLSPPIKSGIWTLRIFTSRSPIFRNSWIILFVRWTFDHSIDISNNCSEIVSFKLERKKTLISRLVVTWARGSHLTLQQ